MDSKTVCFVNKLCEKIKFIQLRWVVNLTERTKLLFYF